MIKVKVLKSAIVEGHGIVSAGETLELQLSHAKTLVDLKFAELVNKSDEKELKVKVNEPVDFEKEPKTSEVEKKLEETSDKTVKSEKKPVAKKEVKEVKKGE